MVAEQWQWLRRVKPVHNIGSGTHRRKELRQNVNWIFGTLRKIFILLIVGVLSKYCFPEQSPQVVCT